MGLDWYDGARMLQGKQGKCHMVSGRRLVRGNEGFFKVLLFLFCFYFGLHFKVFFSLVGVLFLLCPWFSYGFFTRLRVLRRHPGILGFLSLLLFITLHRSVFSGLSYLSLVSMHLRPWGSVRMRRPEMMDGLCLRALEGSSVGDESNRRIGLSI